jgi:phospholipid transport system substrate-binding protein
MEDFMSVKGFLNMIFLTGLVILLLSAVAYAGEPTELAKRTTEKVIEILKNKELKKPEKTSERRAAIRKTVSELFDFEEMAKRSLARYWKDQTPEQKTEFVSLYTDLLERTYIRKIESYTNEIFTYGDETVDGDYAVVKTKIMRNNTLTIPVEYRMMRNNGRWVVYDVVIEGVSLVNNYRTQFSQIIHSSSYAELVKKLKNKEVKGQAND